MLVLKKNKPVNIFLKRTSLLIMLSCFSHFLYAKTIQVMSNHAYTEDSTYYLDTLFDFKLTEEANRALHHGIALEIHTHFQLRIKREWLWDNTVSERKIIYKLEHRPLTKTFLTVNLNTGLRNSYNSLDAALSHINSMSKMKLFDINMLNRDENYIARIRIFLDISSLPPPMRPQAYFSSNWDMSSDWLEWKIVQ